MSVNSAGPAPGAADASGERENVAVRKADLFAYLDGPVGAKRVHDEIAVSDSLAEPYQGEPAKVPRHIWMYWHDGWENAPEIAKLCLRSWKLRNPTYEVYALDQASLPEVLSDPPVHKKASQLSGFANRVRLRLLRSHGGVWADATLFCTKPIDPWIHTMIATSRFFAFASPAPDRIVATWFLASIPQSPLVEAWERLFSAYFERIEFDKRRVHAYFVMAYILEYLLGQHPRLRAVWDEMPKVPLGARSHVSLIARLKQTGEAQSPALDREKYAAISNALQRTNMQKLTWKGAMGERTVAAEQVLEILRSHLQGPDPVP